LNCSPERAKGENYRGKQKMRVTKEKVLSILTVITFVLSVISLIFETSITLIASATVMSVCILLSFIEKGRTSNPTEPK
jgi:hypothetical protein